MAARATDRATTLAVDALLAVLVVLMQVHGTNDRVESDPETVLRPLADLGGLGTGLLVASGAVLVVRRLFPVPVFLVVAAASATYYTLDYPDGPGWIALFVALYGLTAYGDGRRSLIIAGAGIGVLSVVWLVAAAEIEPRAAMGWVFFRIGASVMSAALGESVRTRRVIAAEALARAELAERTREEEARARVDEERLRIAREVHDTVAHAIAVINVQSGVTAHLLDKRPDRVREALQTIEATSARALREMRSILGVLDADPDDRAPQAGLQRIDELVATAREAGLDVELVRTDPRPGLPHAVDLAAYRIAQEAITNVVRHVGPTRVVVEIGPDGDDLVLRVTDDGPRDPRGQRAVVGSGGRGIAGMRERCRLLGGEIDVGPLPGGGFAVVARLPLGPVDALVAEDVR